MTDATAFARLLSPGRIGTMELRNRIVMCPMGNLLPNEDGTIGDNEAAYFEERARGGAALILLGTTSVAWPRGCSSERMPGVSDDRFLPGLTGLAERVHRHGAKIAAQLNYTGAFSFVEVSKGEPILVPYVPKPASPDRISMMVSQGEMTAMSRYFSQPTSRLEYKVADDDDIAWVISRFADSAARCRRAGFDGVEIHAGHGYFIDEFLNPANDRTDRWGGDVEGRARLLCEVVRAIRATVGADFPVWMRINAFEAHKEHGERFEEQLAAVRLAVDAGIDAVHLTAYANTDVATAPTDSYAPHVVGPLADHAARVRAAVPVPVITMGRFEPDEAEAVLRDGKVDFVAMGRKLIADPDLPNKLRDGRTDEIRPCIYHYRCIGNIYVNAPLRCIANARAGVEHDRPEVRTARPRTVLVVGGGPAGLEAARVLAEAGHTVTIWEAGPRLGGVLVDAALTDPLLDRYLGWLVGAVERAGVGIELGRRADVDAVRAFGADEVVVATGATWGRPALPGADGPTVRTVADLRDWLASNGAGVGETVVVVGGGKAGLSIAEVCVQRGRQVTIVEPTNVFGVELGLPGRFRLVADLDAAGVRLRDQTRVTAIGEHGVTVTGADGSEELPADTVIVTDAIAREHALADALEAAGQPVHRVGDCRDVRFLEGTTVDATNLVAALG
jgi:2,4-dienoyl-CoA reductase (NADPH2)